MREPLPSHHSHPTHSCRHIFMYNIVACYVLCSSLMLLQTNRINSACLCTCSCLVIPPRNNSPSWSYEAAKLMFLCVKKFHSLRKMFMLPPVERNINVDTLGGFLEVRNSLSQVSTSNNLTLTKSQQ